MNDKIWKFNEYFIHGILKVIWDNLGYPSSKYFSSMVARNFLKFLEENGEINLERLNVKEALKTVSKFFVDSVLLKP